MNNSLLLTIDDFLMDSSYSTCPGGTVELKEYSLPDNNEDLFCKNADIIENKSSNENSSSNSKDEYCSEKIECIMCRSQISIESYLSFKDVHVDKTQSSATKLSKLISLVLGLSPEDLIFTGNFVCLDCFTLLNQYDELKEELLNTQNKLDEVQSKIKILVLDSTNKKTLETNENSSLAINTNVFKVSIAQATSIEESLIKCEDVEAEEATISYLDKKIDATFKPKNEANSAMSTSDADPEKFDTSYPCPICQDEKNLYSRFASLKKHFTQLHNNVKSFKCTLCDVYFPVVCIFPMEIENTILQHWKTKHPHSVEMDGLQASRINLLTIEPEKRKYAIECVNSSRALNTMNRTKRLANGSWKNVDVKEKVVCPICKQNISRRSLKIHLNDMHYQQPIHRCKQCLMTFTKISLLNHHKASVHKNSKKVDKNISCHLCTSTFLTKSEMVKHVSSVHEGRRDHLCDLCGASYKMKGHLNKHKRSVHLGLRPFRCKICGKIYMESGKAREHVRKKHKIDLKYKMYSVDMPEDYDYPIEKLTDNTYLNSEHLT